MPPAADLNTLSLTDIAAVLRRRRRLILITFLLTFATAVAVTLIMPKRYQTRMKVLVKNERIDTIVSADPNSSLGYRGEVSETQINSEIELLTSKNLLQRVVIKCGLDTSQHESDPGVAVEKALIRLQKKDLDVSAARKANIIVVEYTDTDPRRAVAVLANLADLYLEEHLKVHGTPGTYQFFKGQAERYQRELQDAELRLADFRRRENIDLLPQQKDLMLQKAAESEAGRLQAETAIEEYTQKIADTRRQLSVTEPRVDTQTRVSSNQYSVERLHTMMAELQNRRTQLLVKFRPDDRLVQEVDQEIANTQQAQEKAEKLTGVDQATDLNPVYQSLEIDLAKQQTELAGSESRRQTLARQSWIYRQKMLNLANATAAFDDLVRAKKVAEDDYLLYSTKTEEARIAESLDQQKIANVAIAETPIEPHRPSKPKVPLYCAAGGLMAFFFSLGLAFAAEHFRDTVEQPRELEELTGLPVLATSFGD